MVNPKKIFIAFFGLSVTVFSLFPQPLYASLNNYYDYGPYYQTPQVLGFSLSIQENLPAFKLPDNLQLPSGSGILPDSPFYTFEKAAETAQLAFTFDPVRKEQLRLDFATERLSEAKTLMDQGKTGAASRTLDDYGKTFESVSENVADLAKRGNPQSQNLMEKAEETASAQVVVATALSLTSSPAQAEAWTEAANAGRQALDKIAEAQGEPAIPPDLSEGIQTLKEQGLISEEESNKLYGLKTRSEVRDEFNKLTSSGTLPPSEVIKLDEEIAKRYPEIQKQQLTNLQVVELRSYQALPQPSAEVVENLQKWQEDPGVPPSNDIKPYLWYNRAQNLAKDVNLSNFSQAQQTEVAKLYPSAVTENPTYSPPPSPRGEAGSPSPSPSVSPTPTATPTETTTPSASDTPSPAPSSTPVPAQPYLEDAGGALPGQPTYILKQFGENLSLTFTFDPAEKARLKMEYAEKRLAEAEKLGSDPKNAALYESTLTAYQQTIADASNRVKELKESKIAKKMAEKLEAQAGRHEVVFEKGLLPPPAKNPKLISEVIKATEDAMDRSADALDRPALPPILASRLNDLKAQGLIMPEEVDDLVRSASREEARGKIRKLIELKTFPLADAKKLDEAQALVSPSDYNQLVEVRKVEELQNLRSVQTDLAQTPTLRASAGNLQQKEAALVANFEPSVIKPEDLAGRADLNKVYQALTATASARPINNGQFGPEATPGAQPVITPPSPRDAVLSTCPEGATFKQSEGCVWADTGKNINDYDQYKCDGPRQYYSFAARKCVAYDSTKGWNNGDAQPICPVGYNWSWQTQSCQAFTGGGPLPLPSPFPEPEPKDEKEIEERSKACPEGSSYKATRGCVWNADDKSVYDSNQYRCSGRGQYYSFEEHKCVASPKEGESYPKDASPACKEAGTYWSWSEGKCVVAAEPMIVEAKAVTIDKPSFATPGSFLYPLKQWGETVRLAVAFSPEAKQQVRIDQARERLAEGYAALEEGKKEDFKEALSSYTAKMQELFNDLAKSSIPEGAKKSIGDNLAKEAAEQNLILQKLEALAPADQSTAISAASSVVVLGVDKAADVAGEPPIPPDLKAKIESLPEKMISEEDKKELLGVSSRVEARLKLGDLVAQGGLAQTEIAFLNEDFDNVDPGAKLKIDELKKLEQIATITDQKTKIEETVEKNESIVRNLQEFEKTFEPGQEVAAEIRPYVRLTRINEIAQTIRPDVVRLEDFQNRKDLSLAVATLQEEFRPTKEAIKQIEDFRRRNPGASLPPDLARVEALSFSLGVRQEAGPCYLPTPPFPANTPCPAPGAAIPISSYYSPYSGPATSSYTTPSVDKDGKPLIYGQGPKAVSSGVCTDGYHWMYDSGGWCMSNGGNYSYSYSSSPTGTGSGYTPYSPYYTAPGAPPATSAYPVGDVSLNDGCPYGYDSDGRGNCIRNSYPSSQYSYTAPSYYGSAPTYYTTTPPAGTVPGSGPKPTAPGQCPSGFHWMSDSGGWCMSDGPTYVPGGAPASPYAPGTTTSDTPPAGGYNCGSQPYDPVTKRCKDGACPGGFNWDGSKCVASGYSGGSYSGGIYSGSSYPSCPPGYSWSGSGCQPSSSTYSGSYNSPSSYQYGCTSGYYWNGNSCVKTTPYDTYGSCQPPSSGCGSSSYWDYGSCSCRSSGTYSGGYPGGPGAPFPGISSSGGGAYGGGYDASGRYVGGSYGGYDSAGNYVGTGGGTYCSPPSGGCGSGWWDTGSCSCRQSSSQGCYNVSASSCPSGWYFDSAACTCRQSTTSSGGSTTTSSGGSTSTSSGSCPSGYHWMSDNGGWCMSDGGSSGSSTSPSSTPAPSTSTPPPSSEPAPAPPASSEPAPAPASSEPAPAPASSEPAPAPSP